MITGFDLADGLPALVPGTSDTPVTFVDDDTLLIWRQWNPAWQWVRRPHRGGDAAIVRRPRHRPGHRRRSR